MVRRGIIEKDKGESYKNGSVSLVWGGEGCGGVGCCWAEGLVSDPQSFRLGIMHSWGWEGRGGRGRGARGGS